ncbi:hypothetical protein HH310_05700 [Actinoplanes sp. TBRC 11911]|uniref:hypothetical protein n=1 Tax=Actinoplanes sp. TBRC 11911 TaxID=2729386 RepID=UPI00145D5185|nr:hypothetical protein [Actinoplanes sp. TBRC 11911]NMO50689.1 hypothetical protein [Actinoplanes sp. TBRC 11911]
MTFKKSILTVFAGVVLVGVGAGVFVLTRDDGQSSPQNTQASTSLLLGTDDWGSSLDDVFDVTVETSRVTDQVSKDLTIVRIWRGKLGFQLKQGVQTQPTVKKAVDAFKYNDPGPSLRKHLGGADPISTAMAAHADEGIGYCVPEGAGCYTISYTLRYGTHIINLNLYKEAENEHSAEVFLQELDKAVNERLS